MSRIGKKIITIPKTVTVTVQDSAVFAKGPKGEATLSVPSAIMVSSQEGILTVSVENPLVKQNRALWGTYRQHIANLIEGVLNGFEKKLELVGVGYKASVKGDVVVLEVGFSHPVEIPLPSGIKATLEKNVLTLWGTDKQVLGEVTANIRRIRPPEPYKGKGIKYVGEVIRRKAGKAAKTAGKA